MTLAIPGVVFAGERRGPPGAPPLPSVNLGIQEHDFVASSEHVVFRAQEFRHGADLTGDADLGDQPAFHYDLRRQRLVQLFPDVRQRAGELPVRIEGNTVALFGSEANGDLNGDGDTLDFVAQLYDLSRGVHTNLGLATDGFNFQQFVLREGVLAMVVSERDSSSGLSGQGADLNGDGDRFDQILFLHRVATGETTNTGIAAGSLWLEDGLVGTSTSETAQGADLNGDGDVADSVAHVVHLDGGLVENLGVAGTVLAIRGGRVLLGVLEAQQGGVDRNGDGDATDRVLHHFDLATGTLVNHGLWVDRARGPSYAGYEEPDGDGRYVALYSSEFGQGADLNGDGDEQDHVLHVYDFEAGTVANTGFAVVAGGSVDEFAAITTGQLRFWVDEAAQQEDLNADGDAEDKVLHVRNLAAGTTRNLAFAGASGWGGMCAASGNRIAFQVSEQAQGQTDMNGDGDLSDRILHVHDVKDGSTTVIGATAGFVALDERFLVFLDTEDVSDLNGDGDPSDWVPVLWRLATGTRHELGLAGGLLALTRDHLLLGVSEHDQGGVDANGDGDTFDDVAHVVPLFGRRPF